MKTIAKACISSVEQAQYRINHAIDDLKTRKEHGVADPIDTFEFGFISALKMIDAVYHLDIDFGDEE